jgi:hypothetical protein
MSVRTRCSAFFVLVVLTLSLCGATHHAQAQNSKTAFKQTPTKSTAPSRPTLQQHPAPPNNHSQPGPSRPGEHPGPNSHARGGQSRATPGEHQLPNGNKLHVDNKGNERELSREGRLVSVRKPGMDAHFDPHGGVDRLRTQHGDTLRDIHRGPGGVRVVHTERPAFGGGYVRTVSFGPHRGFVEHPIYGRPGFVRRTYAFHGHEYAVVYRGYHYHGVAFYRPVPAVIYAPGYYGWAVRPWARPVIIQVGFRTQPWFGVYGTAFTPYPVYASPDQWMTDQILADNMTMAYDDGRAAQTAADGMPNGPENASAAPPPISPDLKMQIDAEVKAMINEQGQAATAGPDSLAPPATSGEADQVPDALKPNHTAFRVTTPLTVTANGRECSLNNNDWVTRTGDMDPVQGTVPITISASRSTDCPQGATALVTLNDLMSMDNDMNQQVTKQMELASTSMGKNGFPAGPPTGARPVAGGTASPDQGVAASLEHDQQDATQDEQEAVAASKDAVL